MALPALKLASSYTPLGGKDVLHLDVRSDNLCFRGQQTVLVDWNHTCRGNRDLDVAFWLPSLHSEGGPPPEDVSGLQPCWPATVAGYFAARAGLPPISQAPDVRRVQLSQLRSALPWAARALGLRPLDRPGKSDSSL
jgi:aminoglycoside phosphotransferase (APT) family kinase protein